MRPKSNPEKKIRSAKPKAQKITLATEAQDVSMSKSSSAPLPERSSESSEPSSENPYQETGPLVLESPPLAPPPSPSYHPISSIEIDQLGMRSLEKANTAISAIENALAVWDSAKVKPPELRFRVERLRKLHDAFSAWERRMLKTMAGAAAKPQITLDADPRVPLLREFSDICKR